jgi:hypothetical protein
MAVPLDAEDENVIIIIKARMEKKNSRNVLGCDGPEPFPFFT